MIWDYPSDEKNEPVPPRDEDELYQEYKDRTIEEEWDRLWDTSKESPTTP